MERVYKVPVGLSAYESIPWDAAGVRKLFQWVERLEGGRKSEAPGSTRSRALEDPKRMYTSSNDKNVHGVRKAFRYDTGR